jgi:anti-sigma28 factor (negative regulator of flagellin synthesis)
MRLHLDSSISSAADTALSTPAVGAGARGASRLADNSSARDTSSVSGASSALNQLSAQRDARIAQLTAAVQGGKYEVSSAALSGAIVGQAIVGQAGARL